MPTDRYLTLKAQAEGKYTEKRSRFLSFAIPVKNEDEAKAEIKKYQKKYYDARHVCYAYALGFDAEQTRANDAGEPSGTAGRPILGQIRSAGLTFCLVVVVRYYGGTPLGAANLGRAYQTAAAEALQAAETEERTVTTDVCVAVPYTDVDAVMKITGDSGAEITARQYEPTEEQLTIVVRLNMEAPLRERLGKLYTLRFLDRDAAES